MKKKLTLLCLISLFYFPSFSQLSISQEEIHLGMNLNIPNEEGFLSFFTASPPPTFAPLNQNLFGLHTFDDQSPISIGGNNTFFARQGFQNIFQDEETELPVQGPYSKVFIPGQLRIGTSNTAWNNWKLKIVTHPTNAPFINGIFLDHTNQNGFSYGMLMNVNSNQTKAFVIHNMTLTGQPTQEVFRIDGSGKTFCSELVVMQAGNFPDYVFAPDYKLLSLNEVEKFIK
jgi:hypothetical protein